MKKGRKVGKRLFFFSGLVEVPPQEKGCNGGLKGAGTSKAARVKKHRRF